MATQFDNTLSGSRKLHVLLAAVFIAASAACVEWVFGVRLGEIIRFEIYEVIYVFLPGWMAYVALSYNPGGLLRQLAVGAGVGYALECLMFAMAGSTGVSEWFTAYPAGVAMMTIPIIWRRWKKERELFALPSAPPLFSWLLALTCATVLVCLSVSYFAITPMPHMAGAVRYYQDAIWDISCAAEAKYHWPITDPRVAGEPFYYYTFVFMHLAAASRLTGLELPLIVFRLYVVSFFCIFVLQLYVAGRELGKKRLAGWLAVVITLFIGSIQFWPFKTWAFQNVFYINLFLSPTFMMGLLLFTPLIIEIHSRLEAPSQRNSLGSWLIICLLLIASGGTKGTVLPVVSGGLGVYFIWRFLTNRTFDWPAIAGSSLAFAIFMGWNMGVYSHGGIPVTIHPLASISAMPFVKQFYFGMGKTHLDGFLRLLLLAPFALAGMLGIRTLTTAWILRNAASRRDRAQIWLLSLFVTSLVPFLILGLGANGQFYFLFYGLAALSISSACAICSMLDNSISWSQTRKLFIFGLMAALFLNGIFDTFVTTQILSSWYTPDTRIGAKGDLPQGLLAGLEWIKLNAQSTDVLAVNNQFLKFPYAGKKDPRYFYYSAFSERRVFVEGWSYSHAGNYDDRIALNKRVFDNADPDAYHLLVDKYEVRWLVVDKVHGFVNPLLSKLAKIVYSNSDVDIYNTSPQCQKR